MGNLGIPELIFIFILALLIFGPQKLPELGRTIGKALTEFRRASAELRLTVEEEMRELERQAREVERQAREGLDTTSEPPGTPAPPEEPVGSGTIDPHAGAPPQPAQEAAEEKPADGDPKPV